MGPKECQMPDLKHMSFTRIEWEGPKWDMVVCMYGRSRQWFARGQERV